MPEEEHFEEYLVRLRQLYRLRVGKLNAQIQALEQQTADKDTRIATLETLVGELQEITRHATTLDLTTHPTFLLHPDNTILFANEKVLTLSGYDATDMRDKPIQEHVQGLEFLEQIRSDPILIAVEDLSELAHVPVILRTKQGSELMRSAEINFLTPPRAYNGVRIALQPKEKRPLLQRTRAHMPRYLGGPSNYDKFDAVDYAQAGHLAVRDTPAERSAPLDGTHLLTEVTRRILELDDPTYTRRGVVLNLRTVEGCDPRFYQTLFAISRMKGLPLSCIVYENSEPHQELLKIGFPETSIVKEKKKKK